MWTSTSHLRIGPEAVGRQPKSVGAPARQGRGTSTGSDASHGASRARPPGWAIPQHLSPLPSSLVRSGNKARQDGGAQKTPTRHRPGAVQTARPPAPDPEEASSPFHPSSGVHAQREQCGPGWLHPRVPAHGHQPALASHLLGPRSSGGWRWWPGMEGDQTLRVLARTARPAQRPHWPSHSGQEEETPRGV